MADIVPDGLTRDDVIEAISDFDAGTPHGFAPSTRFDLHFAGRLYPPKAIIGLAARRILRRTLTPYDFKGGEGSRCFRVLRELGFEILPKPGATKFSVLPTEEEATTTFIEGATRLVAVNAYERNSSARKVCIEHYGSTCGVCGFDFATFYGEIGSGFIHVHHLKDLATVGGEYEVDPVNDLRPVCPNCHAMLHVEKPAMSIERLRKIVEAQESQLRLSPSDCRGFHR